MPISDHNATTGYETKTLGDNDGTVMHETAYVYDNDGTTSYIIWQNRQYLIENGLISEFAVGFKHIKQQYDSTWQGRSGYIEMSGNNTDTHGRIDCLNKHIDFSQYNKLCIELSMSSNNPNNNSIDLGLGANELPESTWLPTSNNGNINKGFIPKNPNRQVYEFSLQDVKKIGMLILAVNNVTPTYYIYNMWLE